MRTYAIRGREVMLDRDIAHACGIQTRDLNRLVKRHLEFFPENFCFRLTKEENLALLVITEGKNKTEASAATELKNYSAAETMEMAASTGTTKMETEMEAVVETETEEEYTVSPELKCQIGTNPTKPNNKGPMENWCQNGTSVSSTPTSLPPDLYPKLTDNTKLNNNLCSATPLVTILNDPADGENHDFFQKNTKLWSRKHNNAMMHGWSMNCGGARKPPLVYTEKGALMAASLIRNQLSAEILMDFIDSGVRHERRP